MKCWRPLVGIGLATRAVKETKKVQVSQYLKTLLEIKQIFKLEFNLVHFECEYLIIIIFHVFTKGLKTVWKNILEFIIKYSAIIL